MSEDFVINADLREDQGKGASRRLRRAGKFPAIVYGAGKEPTPITLDHNDMLKHLEHEAFYSHILSLNLGGESERVVLRDIQRHPAKPFILHLDLLRVKKGEALRMNVPLHFIGEDVSPGVKAGGTAMRSMIEVEIECLPRNLPEYIEVDVSTMEIGDAVHLSQIKPPEDVALVALMNTDDLSEDEFHAIDQSVISIQQKAVAEVEPEVGVEEPAEGEAAEEDKPEEGED